MPTDPLSGDFGELERVARDTAALSQESLRNMEAAERAGQRLQRTQAAGPAGPVGGARARTRAISAEAEALTLLTQRTQKATLAAAEFERVQGRFAGLGQVSRALTANQAAIGRAGAIGAGYPVGGGGGRPPGPPRPPAPPGGPPEDGGGAGRARAIADTNRMAQAENTAALATRRSQIEMQRQISVLGSSSQAYRRHGALTTEFIEAAARGEASYREWGYQIGATAAKFAGWTAVSIPVFAALDGVRKIGQGAIQSSSGVQSLQRVMNNVDSSRLQSQFRDLSRQFNLPIDQVSEAVYRMGQVFHNQNDAVEAAKAALYSFRTGEVDVATSTRYLNAIVRGFGLSGTDLVHVYDQVNQAQNQFGITIGDVEAGLARAAGAFKNAGGGVSYLLALIGTMQQVTGRTGQNVGTAVQRSIGFIQRPANQAALKQFGIDTSRGIESIYTQAFQKAGDLQGEQLQKLATALSSPQYASYFVPLLQNYERFQKFLRDTSPQTSAKSAQNELNQVLGQATERLKRLGTELEILGSNLATSGLLAPLAASLDTTIRLTSAGNDLVSAFSGLPAPASLFGINLKQGAVAALAILGALRLAQRFQVGGQITQPLSRYSGILGGGADRGVQRQVGRGIRDEVRFLEDERATRARTAAIAATEADIAQQRAAHALRTNAAEEEVNRLQAGALAQRQRALELSDAEVAINRRLVQAQATANAYQQQVVKQRTVGATEFAAQRGLYYVPTTQRPTAVRPVTPSLREIAVQRAAFQDAPNRARSVLAYMDEVERQGTQVVTFSQRMQAVPARLQYTATRVIAGTRSFGASLGRIGRSLAGMVGPFELILAGAIIIPAVYGAEQRALEAHQRLLDRLSQTPRTEGDLARLRSQVSRLGAQRSADETGFDLLRGPRNILNRITHKADSLAVADANLDEQIRIQQTQNAQLVTGSKTGAQRGPRADLRTDQIDQSVKADVSRINQGVISIREARRRIDLRVQEVNQATGLTPVQRVNLQRQVRSDYFTAIAQRTKDNLTYLNALWNMSGDALNQQQQAVGALIQAGLTPPGGRRRYAEISFEQLLRARQLAEPGSKASTTKPGSGEALLAQVTQQFEQTLEQDGKSQFDRAVLFARSQRDRDRAWNRYINYASTNAVRPARDSLRALQSQRAGTERAIRQVQDDLRTYGGPGAAAALQRGGQGEVIADSVRKLRARLAGLRSTLKGQDDRIKRAEAELKDLQRYERQFRAERQRERFEEQQQLYQAQTDVQAYSYEAGAPRAQYLLRRAHENVMRVIREYGRDSVQALQAIAAYRQAQDAAAQEVEQLAQAKAAYREAGISDPVARARVHIQDLQAQLARFRGDRRHHSAADIYQLMAEIRSARVDVAQQARDEARQLVQAQFALREAQTEDPVKQARLELEAARALIRFAKTPAEQVQARADVARAVIGYRNAQIQGRVDRIEFLREMDRIDAQTAIQMYQNVLKTGHLSKEWRRRIQLAIHALQQEQQQNALELDVGNIRLPTVYEIRRGLALGHRGQLYQPVTNTNHITINVRDRHGVEQVAAALEAATGAPLLSRARAVGAA